MRPYCLRDHGNHKRHNKDKNVLELFISSLTDTYFVTLKSTYATFYAQQFTQNITFKRLQFFKNYQLQILTYWNTVFSTNGKLHH